MSVEHAEFGGEFCADIDDATLEKYARFRKEALRLIALGTFGPTDHLPPTDQAVLRRQRIKDIVGISLPDQHDN